MSALIPNDTFQVSLRREIGVPIPEDGKTGVGIAFMREGNEFVIKQMNPVGPAAKSSKVD
jgi:hypothetical protein